MAGTVSYTEHAQIYQALEVTKRECENILAFIVPRMQDLEYNVINEPRFTEDQVSRFGSAKDLTLVFERTYNKSPERCWAAYAQSFMPLVECNIEHDRIDALDAIDAAWVPSNFNVRVRGVPLDVVPLDVDRFHSRSPAVLQFEMRCRLRVAFFKYLRMYHVYLRAATQFAFPVTAWLPPHVRRTIHRIHKNARIGAQADFGIYLAVAATCVDHYIETNPRNPTGKRPRDDDEVDDEVADEVEGSNSSKRPRHASGFWSVFSSLFNRFQ